MSIRGLSLDAAGTIIEVAQPVASTYASLARVHDLPVVAEGLGARFGRLIEAMPSLAFPRDLDPAQREAGERAWWRRLVAGCLEVTEQHPRFDAFFDALYAYYARPAAWRAYPDAPRLLAAARSAGIPVVVTSNFDTRLHGLLEPLGLTGFRAVLCSSTSGSAKPQPGIFHLACEALALPPGSVLHVGDSERADRDGARAAGLRACWLRRRGGGDATSLDEIADGLSPGPDHRRRMS